MPGRRAILLRLRGHFISLAGIVFLTACGREQVSVLGAPPTNRPTLIAEITNSTNTDAVVTVSGTMSEKCPVAGCWFVIRDSSGTIKIDTKLAGFTVTKIPLQKQLTVSGKVVRSGAQPLIEATGLQVN